MPDEAAGEPEYFHEVAGQLDYPMIIVTASAGGERSGCLVGFHTQGSIHPLRYLVCISTSNHTYRVAARADHLAVHFLDESNYGLSALFGERTDDDTDKFASTAWRDERGAPVLTDAHAWFVGRVLERVPFGDHVGHLVEPVAGHVERPLHQLGFQRVKSMKPGHPA